MLDQTLKIAVRPIIPALYCILCTVHSRPSACLSDRPMTGAPTGFYSARHKWMLQPTSPPTRFAARRTGGLPRQGPTARTTRSPRHQGFPQARSARPAPLSHGFWRDAFGAWARSTASSAPWISVLSTDAANGGPAGRWRLGAAQLLFLATRLTAAVDTFRAAGPSRQDSAREGPGPTPCCRRIARDRRGAAGDRRCRPPQAPEWLWGVPGPESYGEDTTPRHCSGANLVEATARLSTRADAEFWAGKLGGELLPIPRTIRPAFPANIPRPAGFAEGAWWVQDAARRHPGPPCWATSPARKSPISGAAPGRQGPCKLCAPVANVTAVHHIRGRRMTRLGEKSRPPGFTAELVSRPTSPNGRRPTPRRPSWARRALLRHRQNPAPAIPTSAWLKDEEDVGPARPDPGSPIAAGRSKLLKPGGNTRLRHPGSLQEDRRCGPAIEGLPLGRQPGETRCQ